MKIVILDGRALNPGDLSYEPLRQFGELTVYDRTDTVEEAIARIGDNEIVLVNKLPVTEQLLTACPGIRLICVQATGYRGLRRLRPPGHSGDQRSHLRHRRRGAVHVCADAGAVPPGWPS